LFRPIWSADILTELQTALLREEPGVLSQVERMIGLMRRHFPDAEAVGYQPLIDSLECDKADRHVLAAAIKSGSACIVTSNERDFPAHSVEPFGIQILSPDDFLLDLFDLAPAVVLTTLQKQASGYLREPTTVHGLLVALSRSGNAGFADEVRRYVR
jgi:predicted nucleic acid-binding protein